MVAMSGGVDSSVAAALLVRQGYEVIGVTMNLWRTSEEFEGTHCCSLESAEDAYRVARKLGIEHYYLDFRREFEEHVVRYFVAEYAVGRTPNPCVECNRRLKFEFLRARAKSVFDADLIATGHYAGIARNQETGRWLLLRGAERTRDQSYALYAMTQEQLAATLFPVGELSKSEVRRIAAEIGLQVADKPDSQEICFIPENDYRSFLRRYAPEICRPGNLVDTSGRVVGAHEGIPFYTIGQRRGLGAHGPKPRYVVRLDPRRNEVVIGGDADLCSRTAVAEDVNLIGRERLEESVRVKAQIRYNMSPAWGEARVEGDLLRVDFETPQRAITPGQALVAYEGDVLLGGGAIISAQAD